MGDRTCTVNGCVSRHEARGYCIKHYQKWQRLGDPLAGMEYQPDRTCRMDGCGLPAESKGLCQSHYDKWRRPRRSPLLTPEERFWAKVQQRGADECWPWQAAKLPGGYGRVAWQGDVIGAHRVAFELTHGFRPEVVMHRCDDPPCCNPAHLLPGTPALNSADMAAKWRHAYGEKSTNAKLTELAVREIRARAAAGERYRSIATAFGIAASNVGMIVRRVNWRHVE